VNDLPESGTIEGSGPDGAATYPFPWPPPDNASIAAGFVDTWRSVVFQPRRFYAALPLGQTGAALLYYLVIGILTAAIQLFWDSLLPAGGSWLDLPEAASRMSPLTNFLLSPLYLLLSLALAAGITHLLVLVMVPQQRGFSTTTRVFAYAYSPMLFAVVPRVGPAVGFIWMVVIAIIGIREAHRTSTPRAASAVLIPLLIAIVLVVVAALLLATSAVLLSA
jgi:hypothetical protein